MRALNIHYFYANESYTCVSIKMKNTSLSKLFFRLYTSYKMETLTLVWISRENHRYILLFYQKEF